MEHFKKEGGFVAGGELNFSGAAGVYTLKFDFTSNLLTEVVHRSGDAVKVPAGAAYGRDYKLMDNYCDLWACLTLGELKPVYLCEFWNKKSGLGPWRISRFEGKPREFEKVVSRYYENWQQDRSIGMSATQPEAVVKAQIEKHRAEKSQTAMQKARQGATEAFALKRIRRSQSLASTVVEPPPIEALSGAVGAATITDE